MRAEIAIKGGTVIDGSGAPGVVADVAISGGKVVEVGPDLQGPGGAPGDEPLALPEPHRGVGTLGQQVDEVAVVVQRRGAHP